MAGRLILVGEIGRPHGVRGLVKLRSFTADPAAIGEYGPLTDAAGVQRIALTVLPEGLARIEGIADRDAAAKLTGTRLFAERARLPQPEPDEYYLADLVGLPARDPSGQNLGTVQAVEEHGAGAFLVLSGPPERMLPFTRAVVPVVDLAAGHLVVVPPAEITVPPPAGAADAAA